MGETAVPYGSVVVNNVQQRRIEINQLRPKESKMMNVLKVDA